MSWLARLWAWLKPTEQQTWDMAAGTMRFDGWTDIDIELALGPRPAPALGATSATKEG